MTCSVQSTCQQQSNIFGFQILLTHAWLNGRVWDPRTHRADRTPVEATPEDCAHLELLVGTCPGFYAGCCQRGRLGEVNGTSLYIFYNFLGLYAYSEVKFLKT